ncbi:MAG TPA: endonuclease/exonuclease/phosphatase family protein [Bryobacteraceae bacterium]|jgi:endonuclease/exonuclease/phosphatase family metal-dependent hydrolase|nr:endonuclease/exonuclease/phosphatase family protein [Bryobacteraceae bacterium]
MRSSLAAFVAGALAVWCSAATVRAQTTKLPAFTIDELKQLSTEAEPGGALATKLNRLLHTVETGSYVGKRDRPARPVQQGVPILRAAMWNIERGQEYDSILTALTDADEFAKLCAKRGLKRQRLELIREEARVLEDADLLILNEVDGGMKRSGYRDVARELAQALHMNYAYAVEFVEVDPVTLGIEVIPETALEDELRADPARYKGLHGTAILARYPIQNARVLRLPVCHDWYANERKPVPKIEKLKRLGSEKVFLEAIAQERRRGGRIALIAELAVPEAPGGTVRVVNAHLENKCKARCRVEQMNAVLEDVRGTNGPLILAGDLNTTGADGSILSVGYILKTKMRDPRFWAGQALSYFNPLNLYGMGTAARYVHGYGDPTRRDLPVIANNREFGLFDTVRKDRFSDGASFDFSGEKQYTVNGRAGTLANSNERAAKGFTYTFALPRDFKGAIGRYRLDWFFIKPPAGEETRLLRPQFARTMQALNQGLEPRLSDHAPITVDLPLAGVEK